MISKANSNSDQVSDEIDLREIIQLLWANKVMLVVSALVGGALMVLLSFFMTEVYQAEVTLIPAEQEDQSSLSSQFGFAASLAGVNIPSPVSDSNKALAILQSREYLLSFLEEKDIVPWLMASIYDESQNESKLDEGRLDPISGEWKNDVDGSSFRPSSWEIHEEFTDIFSVIEEIDSGLVRLQVRWKDPNLAAQWANDISMSLNQHIKQSDIEEASKAIDFLQNQLTNTQLIEMQRVFYQLIEVQMRTLMLADVREEYAFEIIDHAAVSEKPIFPNRVVYSLFGIALGALLAAAAILLAGAGVSANR